MSEETIQQAIIIPQKSMKNPLDTIQTKQSRFKKVSSSYMIPSESDDTESDHELKGIQNRRKSQSIKLVGNSRISH